jgi:hypothetical protein
MLFRRAKVQITTQKQQINLHISIFDFGIYSKKSFGHHIAIGKTF